MAFKSELLIGKHTNTDTHTKTESTLSPKDSTSTRARTTRIPKTGAREFKFDK